VRVETVAVPVGRAGQLVTDVTRWTENSNEEKLYMFILRVYTTNRTSNVDTLKHLCLGLSLHSFIHLFIHSLTHALIHSFIHSYRPIPVLFLFSFFSVGLPTVGLYPSIFSLIHVFYSV